MPVQAQTVTAALLPYETLFHCIFQRDWITACFQDIRGCEHLNNNVRAVFGLLWLFCWLKLRSVLAGLLDIFCKLLCLAVSCCDSQLRADLQILLKNTVLHFPFLAVKIYFECMEARVDQIWPFCAFFSVTIHINCTYRAASSSSGANSSSGALWALGTWKDKNRMMSGASMCL